MSAGLFLVAPLVAGLLLVVPILVGLVAWVVLRPGVGEPAARARLRRTSGTTTAAATALSVVLIPPAAALALGSPEVAALVVPVAALLHVGVLWAGEAVTSRPHAVRRTALLLEPATAAPLVRRVLLGLLAGSLLGLLGLLAAAVLQGRDPVLAVPRTATLLAVAPAAGLAAVVLLAARQVGRRAQDDRLDPRVDAAGRARAAHRLLRAGAAGTTATLALVLLGHELRDGARSGDPVATVALVTGALLLLGAVVVSLLPPPALTMHPDVHPDVHPDAHPTPGPGVGKGAPTGAG